MTHSPSALGLAGLREAMRALRAAPLVFCAVAALATGLGPRWAHAQGGSADAAAAPDKVEAREKYKRAKADFEAKRYEDALKGFRESYAVLPSPNSHLMIANTMAEMGKAVDAYLEARRVRAEAMAAAQADPKYKETAAAAEQTMARMRPRIGLLTVQLQANDPASALVVAGRSVDRAEWSEPVPVEPGKATVVVTASGGEMRREVEVAAGSEKAVDFRPAAPVPLEEPKVEEQPVPAASGGGFNPFDGGENQRLMAYVVGGVGAASLITFGILGGVHLSKYNDIKDQCTDGSCPADLSAEADKGRGYQTGANVMLGVGLVCLAGGAVLFLTTDVFSGKGDEAAEGSGEGEAAPAAPPPEVSIGPGSISVSGRF
jgi:hypothetical protein